MYLFKNRNLVKMQILSLKRKIILFASLCITAVVLILVLVGLNTSQRDLAHITSYAVEPLAYTCCIPLNNSPRTNIYFIKTHKTGSTTVQNVILRFALRNSLDVMNTMYHMYYYPFSDMSIHPQTKTPNNKYHILAHHVRYDSIFKSYQYADTSTVTILRHPVTHFESSYTYFEMNKTTGMNLEQFLNAPKKPPVLSGLGSFMAYRGYNQISVDLGFDPKQSKNKTAVAEFIEKIDREFDLVMIMEHMEASMVLLANLMGWPLEYMAAMKLNARLPESNAYKLTSRDEFVIMDLNEVDTLLYYHFRNKFRKCVRQFGEQKMNQQIQRLKVINKQFAQRCVTEVTTGVWYGVPKAVDYVPKNKSDLECVYATTFILEIEETVQKTQSQRLQLQRMKWK